MRKTERNEAIVEAYKYGRTLNEIGEEHGISRERVRQILRRQGVSREEGGISLKASEKSKERRAAYDAAFTARWGCSPAFWKILRAMSSNYWNSPVGKYHRQKYNAKKRGIEWKLTLLEWWETWESSGVYEQRGINKGQYVMARFNDVGPYAVGNVYITTTEENLKEYRTREYPAASVADSWLYRRTLTPEDIYEQLHDD